jgi:aryl-alcohol dehydrogenase-like predicted oxidoreductase
VIYKNLGDSGIDVSLICLGTMTWGEQNTQNEAHIQLDYALERGINFFDTAEMYPVPPQAPTYAKTEEIIGNWEKLHSQRDKIILATKIVGPMQGGYIRDGRTIFDRKNLEAALDASLKRLKVDYIDLYQLHWPERHTNFFGQRGFVPQGEETFTPIEERLQVLKEFQDKGKVRAFGLSNETPWGTMTYLEKAKEVGGPRIVSIQNPYNLLNRTYEVGMAEISYRESIGLLAYSPLAFGVLSGKYLGGKKPAGARLTLWERFGRYSNEQATRATERYCQLAHDIGLSPAQMALAYVNTRPFLTSNIIGATSMQQLKENIDSLEIELSSDVVEKIEAIHSSIPNPCP